MKIKFETIGADPEIFLKKDGKVVSAIDVVEADKENPIEIEPGFRYHYDNILLEFSVPPATNQTEFMNNITYMRDYLKNYLNEYEFDYSSSHEVDWDVISSPASMEFGCQPDYNVWTSDVNKICDASMTNLRVAGGHIHIGFENPTDEKCNLLVKALDFYVGLPFIFEDDDTLRRTQYGKAGSFRKKPYGLEYRTLPTKWIENDDLIAMVYNNVQKAINAINSGKITEEFLNQNSEIIQLAINTSNMDLAVELLQNELINQ